MGRMYAAAIDTAESISTATDLFALSTTANGGVIIHEVRFGQEDLTATEFLQIKFHRGTGGSGGTALSEIALDAGYGTASSTVVADQGTQSTQANLLMSTTWNVLTEFVYLPTPEERIRCDISTQFIVELATAPSGATDFLGTIVWEELG